MSGVYWVTQSLSANEVIQNALGYNVHKHFNYTGELW
jgi:hypothetical protein